MVQEETDELIKDRIKTLCRQDCELLYQKAVLIDINKLVEIENELLSLNKYLPVLICKYLKTDYFNYLKINGLYDKFEEKINTARRYTQQEIISEFKQWVKENPQYKYLFDEEVYAQLQEKVNETQKEYREALKLWLQ